MGKDSKIEWTDHTFNPWWGCTKVSPACDFCYAERDSIRYGFSEGGAHFPIWGKDTERRFLSDLHWTQPMTWDRQATGTGTRPRVFCASMADVMEDRRDLDPLRERLWELIEATPNLDWLLLTKRPQNFRRLLPQRWILKPRFNVWLMTTCESQEYDWRIIELLMTPAVVHGISYEPALGPLNLKRVMFKPIGGGVVFINALTGCCVSSDGEQMISKLNWVIAGGESGSSARPSHPEWFRDMRDDCVDEGTLFLFKQHGEWIEVSPGGPVIVHDIKDKRLPESSHSCFITRDGQVIRSESEMLVDVPYRWMWKAGKKAAGRLLDGRTWDEFPVFGG